MTELAPWTDGAHPDPTPAGAPPLLRARAYAAFVDRLAAGAVRPGEFVTQRALTHLTGQPLGAVREMIPRLEAEGLIRTVPQRGLQVMSIDLDLVREAFHLRKVLEQDAFVTFCARADAAELAHVAAAHRSLRNVVTGGDLPADDLHELDWAFHARVVSACGNGTLTDVHRVNQVRIRMIRHADPARSAARMIAVLDEHLAIIYALQARNPDRTAAALLAHLENAHKRSLGL